jgi:hypothetical protein
MGWDRSTVMVHAQTRDHHTADGLRQQIHDPFAEINEYNDSFFGNILLHYFTEKISAEVGAILRSGEACLCAITY